MSEIKLSPKEAAESKYLVKKPEESSVQEIYPTDYEKLREQVAKYRPDILRFVLKMFRGYKHDHDDVPTLAEDLTQQTLTKAIKLIENFDPNKSALKTWLFRIAKTTIIDNYRSRVRQKDIDVDIEKHKETGKTINVFGDPLLRKRIAAAINRMSAKDQEVLTLIFLKGFSYDQIAEKMNITKHSVYSKLNKAKANLKLLLEKEGVKLDEL